MDLREIIVCPAVYIARFAGSSVPAVTSVRSVQPDFRDLSVTGEQFPELLLIVADIILSPIGCLVTVPGGKVDAELQPVASAGLCEFADDVAGAVLIRRRGDRIVGELRRPEAEAIVMLSRQDDSLYAGGFEGPHPLLAVKPRRVEDSRIGVTVSPLAVRESIGPEMDECPDLVLLPGYLGRGGDGRERLGGATASAGAGRQKT